MLFLKSLSAVVLVAAATVASTWYHGVITNRWSGNNAVETHAEQLKTVPQRFAEWRLVDEGEPLSDYVLNELGVAAHFNRVYENDTGNRVTALVMVGHAGPLVRHPVEICYGNRARKLVHGYRLTLDRGETPQRFNVRRYEPKSPLEDEFYVAYGYCYENRWDVPDAPRYEYADKPVMYKMQVLTVAGDTPERESPPYLLDFIEKFSAIVWPDSNR
ncbi:MAG: exosortase-associated EpsI family protein [Planctomycetales bacterium]|nr:exosortase-associated EpsI family protein [Planctomycetales bacterium]